MAGFDHLTAAVNSLTTAATNELSRVSDELKALRDQVAAGGSVTDAQLEALATSVDGVTANLNAFEVPAAPAPTPTEPPPAA